MSFLWGGKDNILNTEGAVVYKIDTRPFLLRAYSLVRKTTKHILTLNYSVMKVVM